MTERSEPRKKSPRAPTVALDEALERALRVYDKDRLHPLPTDIAAKHMGYQNAGNGAALQCLASLRYYGLLERPKDGVVAVSKDVEAFKFAPSEELKRAFLRRFVSTPPLFAELLDRIQGGMPSDESLRYDLIQRGFIPSSASTVVATFKRSVEFAGVLNGDLPINANGSSANENAPEANEPLEEAKDLLIQRTASVDQTRPVVPNVSTGTDDQDYDRIPVRLSGGRRAWIVVPAVFFDRDKERLKAQINLLLTQDDEDQ